MTRAPSLFLSHGSPMTAVMDTPARRFLQGLGRDMHRPEAILIASAHWNTRNPAVAAVAQPETIHDFGGFPDELYRLQYPAPGSPALAAQVAALLPEVSLNSTRGLDHGAWVPLMLMYPEADIPVVQLSLQPHAGTAHHVELGQRLKPLRDQGVMIIGSGSLTHNLYEIGRTDVQALNAAKSFADWMEEKVQQADVTAVSDYRAQAPAAEFNHPTEEHLLPLHVAMGAGYGNASTLHRSMEMGILAMDAYSFA